MLLEHNIKQVIEFIENPAQLQQIASEAMQLIDPKFSFKPPLLGHDPPSKAHTLVDSNDMEEGDHTDDQKA